MSQPRLKVFELQQIYSDILFVYFEKPANFHYLPGQFIEILLEGIPEWYPFTLASAPSEDRLLISTKIRNTPFKQKLMQLTKGEEMSVTGPWGNFVLPATLSDELVFIAGGLGVNVFRSMLLERYDVHNITKLFVSAHTLADLLYHETFRAMPQLEYIPIVTGGDHNAWKGENERISVAMFEKYSVSTESIIYIVGPVAFVHDMIDIVIMYGVKPENIRVETFPGY